MSAPDFDFLVNPSLPSHDTIVALCEAAGDERTGIPLHDPSSGLIIAWVKYGPYVAMAEALTQDYVAKFLVANSVVDVRVPRVYAAFPTRKRSLWDFGYIIMEYIDAPDCGEEDYRLAAKAVQKLISIKGPNDVPGPIGGGRAVHTFFVEWTSPINYTTVGELQQHINGIIKHSERARPVDLVADAQDGLYLCPCDITRHNFKKCEDGTVVALNFYATCFLPPVFLLSRWRS